ncbi:hypothetical protein [Hydrogenophaga atypica]|uniref:Uncharacterized protein n=1 Tax=Hydrogenophaga atypica TaxID=249409 RepID=A0ABW2QJS4_9BURK
MVFLAITAGGLQDALRASGGGTIAVWCGADAISEADYARLEHANVSRFIYPLCGEVQDVLTGAINTIKEHHPGESVWIENCA